MKDHELFQKTFSHLHASENTLEAVMDKAQQKKNGKTAPKRLLVLAAVVTVFAGLAVAAHASGAWARLSELVASMSPAAEPGQVVVDAYGNGISTDPIQLYAADGTPIKMPTMERQDITSEEAQRLIGAYVNDVQGSFTLGENTITIQNFLIDEDGSGMMLWTMENPTGVIYTDSGYGSIYFPRNGDIREPMLEHYRENDRQKEACLFNKFLRKNEAGTCVEFVSYFGTFSEYQPGDRFVWVITDGRSQKSMELIPTNHIGVNTLTDESGRVLRLSNIALSVGIDNNPENCKAVVIHFQDGSQYCVEDEDVLNHCGGLLRRHEDAPFDEVDFLLNRVIDVDQVTHVDVTLSRHIPEEQEIHLCFYP